MFVKDEINNTRQLELDVAKAFAVIFMITVHVFDHMTAMNGKFLPKFVELLGCPPAAGVFMLAMGVGMVYTRHNSPKEFAVRGVKLLIMGYVLNFFRETLLVWIASLLQIENSYENESLFSTLMTVDILQFAGAAFLITALLKKLNAKPWQIFTVAIIMHAVGNLCVGLFDNTPETVQYPLGVLLFTNDETAFPAFQWYIYPAVGICFGEVLKHVNDKDKFYLRMEIFAISALFCVTVGCIRAKVSITDMFMTAEYYSQSLLTTLWCMSIVFLCIPIYYIISKVLNKRAVTAVKYISSNVNTIYIIQWLVITYTIAIMEISDIELFDTAWGIPISLAVTIICILICMAWNKIRKGKTDSKHLTK